MSRRWWTDDVEVAVRRDDARGGTAVRLSLPDGGRTDLLVADPGPDSGFAREWCVAEAVERETARMVAEAGD